MMAKTVSKDMIISDLIQVDPNIVAILMRAGMHCIGCPASQGESLEEAAMVHGVDVLQSTEKHKIKQETMTNIIS